MKGVSMTDRIKAAEIAAGVAEMSDPKVLFASGAEDDAPTEVPDESDIEQVPVADIEGDE